ncbi:mannitol dehydrogenase family protein [Leifsonia sp. 21MFCrub1.1]|uniref:mannitol dehydrogenase family protein n=1 Tax=Leifsonia sp. 21MFCrub1.1 TaxID=1798223 RepID=UPI0008928774|nr:mannitol dehydrogenase family protein [Leifsonia sp. 21MFCrub1.1]SEB08619.1 fructuronate reductase [Leifsonia sp. 21MFCrub1.1]
MTAASTAPLLTHDALPHPDRVPPVRIVHLGLGAFHRSHQAWYTAHAADSDQWGIAAFTGRTPDAAEALAAQGCVYTLIERGPEEDRFELIGSIVQATAGGDLAGFVATLAGPEIAVVTLTVTEAGYRVDAAGELDVTDPDVSSDIRLLRRLLRRREAAPPARDEVPTTVLGRLLLGLNERRLSGAPPIAIVPCDNLPDNGPLVRRALDRLAREVDPALADWLPRGASFVSTSVDRITPRLEQEDRELVAVATGWFDETPVVTEPFADWVLAGEFPSGRPQWETAGARFVDDITPWEARKLWMLNGAHTLLASSGRSRGHATVAEAFADPVCREQVDELWVEAARNLPTVETAEYRLALAERFANPRIVHRLAQIAEGSRTKMRLRIVPIALAERKAGRSAVGCATAVAAWIRQEAADDDPRAALRELAPELADDEEFATTVQTILSAMMAGSAPEKAGTLR